MTPHDGHQQVITEIDTTLRTSTLNHRNLCQNNELESNSGDETPIHGYRCQIIETDAKSVKFKLNHRNRWSWPWAGRQCRPELWGHVDSVIPHLDSFDTRHGRGDDFDPSTVSGATAASRVQGEDRGGGEPGAWMTRQAASRTMWAGGRGLPELWG